MGSITGVIVARFQTPYLHQGHMALVNATMEKHNKVIIVLGTTTILGSRRNPFDFHTREKMVKEAFPSVVVLPLGDNPSDQVWSGQLDRLLSDTFSNEKFVLYGSRDSFIDHYHGHNPVVELAQKGNFNATEIRDALADQVQLSQDFRAGILYAYYNAYPKVYPTVDIAMFKNQRSEILLGQKANAPHWRLLGGFVDPDDEDYEAAAHRELREECGWVETSPMGYEKTFKVDDWRYRNESDKIITTLFSCDYLHGAVQAQDDIVAVGWHGLAAAAQLLAAGQIAPEHAKIMQFLLEKYNEKK